MSQTSTSPKMGRRSLDLRDVVKDSMYREARGLSVNIKDKEEPSDRLVKKDRDSPRLLQHSKSVSGMQDFPTNLDESLRALAKLKESPWYVNEVRDRSRPSFESADGLMFSAPKDAPRFSYDGREALKSAPKLKELPRLSLDSREVSMHSFNSESKSSFPLRNSVREGGNSKRPPSVIAKLMGLETLPDHSDGDNQLGLIKTNTVESPDPFLRSSRVSNSPQSLWNEPASPRWKTPDSVMKPISSSRVALEPAPWKQLERSRGSEKPASRSLKSPTRDSDSITSVYSQIDKRLKDLEFNQSGNDLRALKQILDAMQAKGLLDTGRQEQDYNFSTRTSPPVNAGMVNQQKPHDHRVINSRDRGSNYESPIVIMKPAKLVEKHGVSASSVITMDHLSGLSKLRDGDYAHGRKGSVTSLTSKEQVPQTGGGGSNGFSLTGNKKSNNRNRKSAQSSTQSQQLLKEKATSLVKASGSVSPRLEQRKLELEKRSRPPISPDSSKSRREPNKQQPESSSPGGKRRPRTASLQQNDDQSSDISSETRNLSYQEDVISMRLDENILSDSGTDTEVASSEQCVETKAKQEVYGFVEKKLAPRLSEDGALAEFASVAPENPSPVSVLDDTMYGDDALSPVKQISDSLKDDETMDSNNDCSRDPWNPEENLESNSSDFGLKSGINRMKLQDIENLVQKLRRLNSSHNEAHTDYIASLCENTNPDHRYVSEILLASGLLLRDLNSSPTTFQLHPSGHPINPELFLVLEQTKSSAQPKEDSCIEKFANLKPEKETFHRKLIFDAVNEILIEKLASVGGSSEPWLRSNKIARKSLTAQKLLKELCSEIGSLQEQKAGCGLENGNDGLKSIFWGDVMHGSENWTGFQGEISGMALDLERLIFKDLVGEIVKDEAAGLRTKPGRHCRRLFE